ncbi:hypothetical protein [Acinetobacter sp.]|uniref:hypothetical protein n=1 Tax=Acinetobacter sp. TaxID=472 RepID=UPI0031D0E187
MSDYPLPKNMQAIAEVIGREKALFLLGQLPRTKQVKRDTRTRYRIYLYIPKTLNPKSRLVEILGWNDAFKLTQVFTGETICLESCKQMATDFLHRSIRTQFEAGASIDTLVISFGMNPRSILKIIIQ